MNQRRTVLSVAWLGLGVGLALAGAPAHAVITCNVASSGFSAFYDPTAPAPNDNAGFATVSCTRALSDPESVSYTLHADNGMNPQGQTNRVRLEASANLISYELYRNATYASVWGPQQQNGFSGTLAFNGSLSAQVPITYYARFPAGQNAAQGTYGDTVTMSLKYGAVTAPAATFAVSASTIAQCEISTPPGTVSFAYTSFQSTPAAASAPYAVRCTSGVPYTMALDAPGGTLLGLAYTLSLSAASATGNGSAQAYSVNGSIAPNQAGACAGAACTASEPRTLTITY
jgi:spore coat protein U-like protein